MIDVRPVAARTAGLALLVPVAAVLAAVCYVVSPLLPVVAGVGLAYLGLAITAPSWAVGVACMLAPFESVQVPVAGLGSLSPTEAAFLVLAAAWTWRALSRPDEVHFPGPSDLPAAAFVLALLPGVAIGVPISDLLRLSVMWTAFFLVYLTVREMSPPELRRVLLMLGLGAGILALLGIVSYLAGGGAQLSGAGTSVSGRANAGIPDPNYYGSYLQLASVPLLALVVAKRTRLRPVGALVLLAVAAAIVVSLSRGALLAAAIAVGIVVMAWSRTRLVTAAVALALVTTAALNVNPLLSSSTTEVVKERVTSVGQQSENNKRTLIWSRSLGLVYDDPAFGIGALQFPRAATELGLTQNGDALENVHNLYLNVAVELGLFGLGAYLLWLWRLAAALATEWRRRRPETFPIVVGVAASLTGYSVQALTVSQYRVQTILATFFVLAGVAMAARAWSPTPRVEERMAVPATGWSGARR